MRQLFFGDLLELLVAELMAAGRSADAERYAVQVSAQQHQEAFGQALVERIKAGQKPR